MTRNRLLVAQPIVKKTRNTPTPKASANDMNTKLPYLFLDDALLWGETSKPTKPKYTFLDEDSVQTKEPDKKVEYMKRPYQHVPKPTLEEQLRK